MKIIKDFKIELKIKNFTALFFVQFYSILFLIKLRSNTGNNEITENKNNKIIDCHENTAVWLVSVFRVVPACMYKHDGGATPFSDQQNRIFIHLIFVLIKFLYL